MNSHLLQATALTKVFTRPARFELLKGIDFSLNEGECVAILGKSGEGKSTLLHILAALDEPTSGTLWFRGKQVVSKRADSLRNRSFGFVFQAFHLLVDATVIENLLIPCAIARFDIRPQSPHYKQACALLEKVGLLRHKELLAATLSGGEKQRLAIARAFMCQPDIIFADEPTGNLDHETAREIQTLLFSWAKEENKSLLFVTHSQQLAHLCDRSYLLESGTLSPAPERALT